MSNNEYTDAQLRALQIINNPNNVETVDVLPGRKKISKSIGYYSKISAIFIDIRESTDLFQHNNKTTVAKIIKCFSTELLTILGGVCNIREIGVRGDCVYAIYNTPNKEDNNDLMEKAIQAKNVIIELNEIFEDKKMPTINVGIGLATGDDLVIGITKNSNKVWIGKAVTTASKLCDRANKGNNEEILISDEFHNTIKENYQKDQNKNLFKKHKDNDLVYYGYVK